VREEKTRHVPYKYKALETRKKREERRDREKAGERPNKKKRAENRGT